MSLDEGCKSACALSSHIQLVKVLMEHAFKLDATSNLTDKRVAASNNGIRAIVPAGTRAGDVVADLQIPADRCESKTHSTMLRPLDEFPSPEIDKRISRSAILGTSDDADQEIHHFTYVGLAALDSLHLHDRKLKEDDLYRKARGDIIVVLH
jgi:hypothetical protein